MNAIFKSWKGYPGAGADKRKRASAEDFFDENSRKRSRPDAVDKSSNDPIDELLSAARAEEEGPQSAREIHRSLSNHHASSSSPPPPAATTRDPLPSPSIHPDRLKNFDGIPPSAGHCKYAPLSLLSKSPDDVSEGEIVQPQISRKSSSSVSTDADKLRRASTSKLDQSKNLRIDPARAINNLDPRNPDYTPQMAAEHTKDERAQQMSPSNQGQRIVAIDSYRPSPLSRRPSETMEPPLNGSRSAPVSAGIKPFRIGTSSSNSNAPTKDGQIKGNTATRPALIQNLNLFAQSITSAANLSTRSDLAKKETTTVDRERGRQMKNRTAFRTLVEDTELKTDGIQKSTSILERQMEQNQSSQSKATTELVSNIQRAIPVPPEPGLPIASADSNHILKELAKLRAEIADLKADQKDYRRNFELYNDNMVTKRHLERYVTQKSFDAELDHYVQKHEYRSLEKSFADLKVSMNKNSDQVKDLQGKETFDITQVREGLAKLESSQRGDSKALESLKQSMTDVNENFTKWGQDTSTQNHDLDRVKNDYKDLNNKVLKLQTFVSGDSDSGEKGLDKLIEEDSNKTAQMQEFVNHLNETVQQLEESLATKTSESSQVTTQIQNDPGLREDVDFLRKDLDSLTEEQLGKDEAISLALDQNVYSKIHTHEVDISSLKADLASNQTKQIEQISRLKADLVQFQLQQGAEIVRLGADVARHDSQNRPSHPSTPSLPNGAWSPKETSRQKLQDLESGLEKLKNDKAALETLVLAQQQKFDGLTTDQLVQSMVHELRRMYPHHPANVLEEVRRIGDTQLRADQFLAQLGSKLRLIDQALLGCTGRDSALEVKINEVSDHSFKTRQDLLILCDDMKKDISTQLEIAHKQQENAMSLKGEISEIKDRHDQMEKDTSEKFGTMTADIDLVHRKYLSQIEDATKKNELIRALVFREGVDDIVKSKQEYQDVHAALASGPGSLERSITSTFHTPRGSTPSEQQRGRSNDLAVHGDTDDDDEDSDTPLSTLSQSERKRKRHLDGKVLSDDEDGYGKKRPARRSNGKPSRKGD